MDYYEVPGVNITLTPVDRLILKSYADFCDGVSDYLGTGFEIVLHSLENCEHSAIKVINGFHTGRQEGAPITDLALNMLAKLSQGGRDGHHSITYFTNNKMGEPLKSATVPIYGENDRIIGLFCINFYLNTPLSNILQVFSKPKAADSNALVYENFSNNVDDLILVTVTSVRDSVYADMNIPANNKNKEIIRLLNEQGIFNLKDGVAKTADILNISKNTVYLHLRNQNGQGGT